MTIASPSAATSSTRSAAARQKRPASRAAAKRGSRYQAGDVDYVAGTYRRRITLDSGGFAVIADSIGFQFVPCRPSPERQLGPYVSGVARGIDWSLGRKRGH